MERILVTGGAGYLGSVLITRLLEQGHEVTALDKRGETLLGHVANPRFDFVDGDVRDESLMRELVNRHDTIVPLAALVGAKLCAADPVMAEAVNYESIVMLNRLRGEEHKVIFPCTNSGYGTKSGEVFCTEETPLEPISIYGDTKVRAEQELLSRPNTVTFRLATVFGPSPRMRLDLLVNDFTFRAATDGFLVIYEKDFKRNFLHVEDVAEGFMYALEHFDAMKGETYNFGLEDANLSKEELAEKIKEQVPSLYIHYAEVGTDPDKRNYIVSNAKLAKAGYEAHHSLDEGIGQVLKLTRMLGPARFANA